MFKQFKPQNTMHILSVLKEIEGLTSYDGKIII